MVSAVHSFADAIQDRVRVEVTRHEREVRGVTKRWVSLAAKPQRITLPMARFSSWPEIVEGEVDGYRYRATPQVTEDQRYVTFEMEVLAP